MVVDATQSSSSWFGPGSSHRVVCRIQPSSQANSRSHTQLCVLFSMESAFLTIFTHISFDQESPAKAQHVTFVEKKGDMRL
jgi:hypothetical protein